jgi:ATP-dependent Clp endopeptidase proteolytic subunit ClpP
VFYSIRADGASKTVDLELYDLIGVGGMFSDTVSAKAVRRVLADNADAKVINLHVNSKGGDVLDGFAIYDTLMKHKARVIAHVEGIAASMASVIICAADEVQMAAGAWLMVHDPSGGTNGRSKDLRKMADILDKMRGAIADTYAARTGQPVDALLRMMDAETWLTATEAKAKGFVDTIVPAKTKTKAARALACVSQVDLEEWTNVPKAFAAEVLRTSEPNFADVADPATLETIEFDIPIEVEDVTEEEKKAQADAQAAQFSAALTAALAPITAELSALKQRVEAAPSPTLQASADDATKFAAQAHAACERFISAGKLPNSPEARAFFAAQAKDAPALQSLCSFYDQAPVVVTVEKLNLGDPSKSGKKFTDEQIKLAAQLKWDLEALFKD